MIGDEVRHRGLQLYAPSPVGPLLEICGLESEQMVVAAFHSYPRKIGDLPTQPPTIAQHGFACETDSDGLPRGLLLSDEDGCGDRRIEASGPELGRRSDLRAAIRLAALVQIVIADERPDLVAGSPQHIVADIRGRIGKLAVSVIGQGVAVDESSPVPILVIDLALEGAEADVTLHEPVPGTVEALEQLAGRSSQVVVGEPGYRRRLGDAPGELAGAVPDAGAGLEFPARRPSGRRLVDRSLHRICGSGRRPSGPRIRA